MRSSLFVSLLAVGAVACASSPSSSGGAAPAAAPAAGGGAAQSATGAGANPCAAGGCRITVEIDPTIQAPLNEKVLTFKVWKGCPRDIAPGGVGDTRTLKDALADTRLTPINLKPFSGTKTILAFWFGPSPTAWTVVDFASGPNQTVKAPWMQGGANGYQSDDVVARQHASAVRSCR